MSNNMFPGGDPFQPSDGFGQGGFNLPPGASGAGYTPPARAGSRPDTPSRAKNPKRGKKEKEKAPKTTTKRLLNKQRVFAIAFALVAIMIGLNLSSQEQPSTYVVRATTAVPALSKVEPGQYEIVALPTVAVEEGAISGDSMSKVETLISELFVNARTRMSFPKGHQFHQEDFSGEVQLAVPLGANERILALEASVVSAIGGQLRAGDRVDVIAVISYQNKTYSNVVASNVEIIAALPGEQQFNSIAQQQAAGSKDKGSNELLPSDPVPGIYNVRVDLNQAVVLAAAQSRGELVLVLRGASASDTAVSAIDLESTVTKDNGGSGSFSPIDPAG